jgi:branched-chain amino acid aminotransferase
MPEEVHPRYLWFNGELRPYESAMVHVNALGHATVSGVYEGIRAYWNSQKEELHLIRLREHMERWFDSIKIVRMKPHYSLDQLTEALVELFRANEYRCDSYVLPMAFLGGIGRAFSQPEFHRPTEIVMESWTIDSVLPLGKGISCCVSSWIRLADTQMPPRVKCVSNYHNGRLASMQAQLDGYDQAILLNQQGKVTEAPGACLFVIRKGVPITPPVTAGILESVTRAGMIELFQDVLDKPVQERDVDRTELYVADEIFLCGTGFEATPVTSVDRYTVGDGQVGPITREISQVYHDIVRGIDDRYAEWRTPVWGSK